MTETVKEATQAINGTDSLAALRIASKAAFERLGFPTARHEEWKYTSLKELASLPLDFTGTTTSPRLKKADLEKFRIAGAGACLVVFENGLFNPSLSEIPPMDSGIIVKNLATCVEEPEVIEYLGKTAPYEQEAFVALNNAYFTDGVYIRIADKADLEKPVHILYMGTGKKASQITTVRNLVVAGKYSRAVLTESYHSLDDDCSGITNSVTEVVVRQNATLELVKAQLESLSTSHISFTQATQERDSIFDTVTLTLGGKLVRNNLHIKLNDTNCTAHLFGLYLLNGEQLADNHTLVDHAMPHCFSNELYKGILDGKSTGVFNGKIMVRQDAQKTNAYQSNKTILLSDDAQMNAKPQLEIFADDVKCTHGATTGQLDEEALFYLRSRGIGEQNARTLLNIAFAADVLNNIKSEELRNNLQALAERKLMC